MKTGNKLPFILITGFLGSGKTTLLRGWLKDERFRRAAVIVNEFGTVGLDHRVLKRVEEKTTLLQGGCACCNVRDDLVRELTRILNERDQDGGINCVIMETTGLADPAPIMFSILTHPVLQHHFYIDRVITTLDAVNGKLHLDRNPESVKQLAAADHIVLTKTDLADRSTLEALRVRVKTLSPTASVAEAENGNLDAAAVFDGAPTRTAPNADLGLLRQSEKSAAVHAAGIRSMSVRFYEPLDWVAFGLWLSMLLYARGEQMLRVKGIVDAGESGPVVLNGVQHIIHPPQHLDSWLQEERRSEIVFIMKQISPDEILASLRAFQDVIGAKASIHEIQF